MHAGAQVVVWLFLGLRLLHQSSDKLTLMFGDVLPIAIVALSLSSLVDRIYYGEWTFVIWNFVRFNFGSGTCVGSAMYGTSLANIVLGRSADSGLTIILGQGFIRSIGISAKAFRRC